MPNNARYTETIFKNLIRNILPKELSMSRKNKRKNIQGTRRKNILHRSRLHQKRLNMLKKSKRNQNCTNMNQKEGSTLKKGSKRNSKTRRKGSKIVFRYRLRMESKYRFN